MITILMYSTNVLCIIKANIQCTMYSLQCTVYDVQYIHRTVNNTLQGFVEFFIISRNHKSVISLILILLILNLGYIST